MGKKKTDSGCWVTGDTEHWEASLFDLTREYPIYGLGPQPMCGDVRFERPLDRESWALPEGMTVEEEAELMPRLLRGLVKDMAEFDAMLAPSRGLPYLMKVIQWMPTDLLRMWDPSVKKLYSSKTGAVMMGNFRMATASALEKEIWQREENGLLALFEREDLHVKCDYDIVTMFEGWALGLAYDLETGRVPGYTLADLHRDMARMHTALVHTVALTKAVRTIARRSDSKYLMMTAGLFHDTVTEDAEHFMNAAHEFFRPIYTDTWEELIEAD